MGIINDRPMPNIHIEFDANHGFRDIVADRFDAGVRLGVEQKSPPLLAVITELFEPNQAMLLLIASSRRAACSRAECLWADLFSSSSRPM